MKRSSATSMSSSEETRLAALMACRLEGSTCKDASSKTSGSPDWISITAKDTTPKLTKRASSQSPGRRRLMLRNRSGKSRK